MASERVLATQGDITTLTVDAIVNAANSSLLGGGGVDGAIHRRGGPAILTECRQIVTAHGRLPTGQAVVTTAGNLPCRWVIHTVGPVWHGGTAGEPELLADAYRNSLSRAVEVGARTVAFPGISTGVYGYPKQGAAEIAVREVRAFLAAHPELEQVNFCCFDAESLEIYLRLLAG
ncbi:MAG: O-acetyl-ADP-ribose deacetylase [Armatimonadetes bacterium]|nr:O-acetyl-ADP-ribose deacetylase [Armatimonadota bacterium]